MISIHKRDFEMKATKDFKSANPKNASARNTSRPSEPLDLYMRDVESHKLLTKKEEKELLTRLVRDRDTWATSFLHTEAALELVWADICAWRNNEIAGSSLIPGPPRLKPGQIGPDDHLKRLDRIFSNVPADRDGVGNKFDSTLDKVAADMSLMPGPEALDPALIGMDKKHGVSAAKPAPPPPAPAAEPRVNPNYKPLSDKVQAMERLYQNVHSDFRDTDGDRHVDGTKPRELDEKEFKNLQRKASFQRVFGVVHADGDGGVGNKFDSPLDKQPVQG